MAKKHLILHIGLHKTGTTAIQRFLNTNKSELVRQGFYYPQTPYGPDHNSLFTDWAVYKFKHAMHDFARLEECHTLLISSEELSTAFLDQSFLASVAENFRSVFEVTVVIYLRRQDFLKERIFAEVVKDWYVGSIFSENHYELDFLKRLSFLEDHFGKSNMIVRLYDENKTRCSRWIIDDFCSVCNIVCSVLKYTDDRPNVTMHRRKTLFLSHVPLPKGPITKKFLDFLSVDGAIKDDGIPFLSPPAYRQLLIERQAGNNALVSQRFMKNVEIDCVPPANDAAWREPAPISMEEAGATLGSYIRMVVKEGERVETAPQAP